MVGRRILRKLSKDSQAALEFLMTYGWAILVVLISVFVLAYFGVLSLDMFVPNKCILPAGIACLDYRVESYRVILVLQNAYGEAMTINEVTVSGNNQDCSSNESVIVSGHEKAIFTITECNNGAEGKKFDGAINVTYVLENKLTHKITGTLKAKVVEGSSVSSQNVCQNAETNGLCNGLDIVFGIGYKDACCNEYSLCCS